MRLDEYAALDAIAMARLVASGEVSPAELAALALRGVALVDEHLGAVIETWPERAGERYLASLPGGPLAGVPMLNKDLSFAEAGQLCEMGSLLARGHRATVDSTAFARLRGAGAVFLGRTTTPEFGCAGITESRISGVTRNPWDPQRTPGGSSGGSAAMVAAGVVPVATASDSGGSTRGPAGYCGLVGLKQSRGRVPAGPLRGESNNGLGAQLVVSRSVRDTALCLDLMSGADVGDPYGIAPPARPFLHEVDERCASLRIASMPRPWSGGPVSEDAALALNRTLAALEESGHVVEEVPLEVDWERLTEALTVVFCANLALAVDGLSRARRMPADSTTLTTSTLACYEYGKALPATRLLAAQETFNTLSRDAGRFFESYDLLATPTQPDVAPTIRGGYRCDPPGPVDAERWQAEVAAADPYMPVFNVTGQPAISLPVHAGTAGLPVGVQLAARFGDEATLLRVGAFLEQAMPWRHRLPTIHVAHAGS